MVGAIASLFDETGMKWDCYNSMFRVDYQDTKDESAQPKATRYAKAPLSVLILGRKGLTPLSTNCITKVEEDGDIVRGSDAYVRG